MVTEIHCNHIDAHAEILHMLHKIQISNYVSPGLSKQPERFHSCAEDLVIRIVSHSRLGEQKPICKILRVNAEVVVSFEQPELTTYSIKTSLVCQRGLFRSYAPDLTTYRHKT